MHRIEKIGRVLTENMRNTEVEKKQDSSVWMSGIRFIHHRTNKVHSSLIPLFFIPPFIHNAEAQAAIRRSNFPEGLIDDPSVIFNTASQCCRRALTELILPSGLGLKIRMERGPERCKDEHSGEETDDLKHMKETDSLRFMGSKDIINF